MKLTALDALLQNPGAPTVDLQPHLDIIPDKQRGLHELGRHIQASLIHEEFDPDVLDAIEYDERIGALRTLVRSISSPVSSAGVAAVEPNEPYGSAY